MPTGSPNDLLQAASTLRRRSRTLRWSANRLSDCLLAGLGSWAGADTWAGPTARVFLDDCRIARTELDRAGESLRASAAALDRQAALLEQQARVALVAGAPGVTGYLAIDRDRVAALKAALARAMDDLSELAPDDPAAADASATLRGVGLRFDPWPSLLDRVIECTALTIGPSFGLSSRVLVSDAFAASTPEELALAGRLAAERFGELAPEDWTVERLDRELSAVAHSPVGVAAFLEALGPGGSRALVEWAGHRIYPYPAAVPSSTADHQATVAILRVLGTGLGSLSHERDGPFTPWMALATFADPYTASLMIGSALDGGSPGRLAPLAIGTFRRLFDHDRDGTVARELWRDGAAYLLLGLSHSPAAARATIEALGPDDLTSMLFSVDPDTAGAMLVASADPRWADPADVESSMLRVIDVLGAYKRGNPRPEFAAAPGWRPGMNPRERAESSWLIDPSWRYVPTDLAGYVAPYLSYLVTPIASVGWAAAGYRPWDVSGHDDALGHTLALTMSEETSAAELWEAAERLTEAAGSEPDAVAQARYLQGALIHASTTVRNDAIATHRHDVEQQQQLIGAAIGMFPATLAADVMKAIGVPLFVERAVHGDPDGTRETLAEGRAAIVLTGVRQGIGALQAWSATNLPGATALPAPPPADRPLADPGGRADALARPFVAEVNEWLIENGLATIDDHDQLILTAAGADAADTYNRARTAVNDGGLGMGG